MSIASKSKPPTPTMIMDRGKLEEATISSVVFSRSVIAPSVKIRRMVYYYFNWVFSAV
jgi:hypothetical protein